jgi:hypothetical protein
LMVMGVLPDAARFQVVAPEVTVPLPI